MVSSSRHDRRRAAAFVKTQHHLTLDAAEAVLAAAVAQAESLGAAAVVVVTDAAGGVTSLARLDGAPPIAIRHALAKANSASGLKRSTDEFLAKRLTQDDVLWRAISGRSDAFVVHGGFPLTVDGRGRRGDRCRHRRPRARLGNRPGRRRRPRGELGGAAPA